MISIIYLCLTNFQHCCHMQNLKNRISDADIWNSHQNKNIAVRCVVQISYKSQAHACQSSASRACAPVWRARNIQKSRIEKQKYRLVQSKIIHAFRTSVRVWLKVSFFSQKYWKRRIERCHFMEICTKTRNMKAIYCKRAPLTCTKLVYNTNGDLEYII